MYSSEKEMYETPAVQVVEVAIEGVICGSGDETPAHGNGFSGGWC